MNARLAAAFVNERAAADDLVIASPALAWLIEANVTDYQISLAFDGLESRHFPTDIPRDRFLFDVSIRNARYVIVDRTIDNWAATNVPDIATILERTTQRPPVAQYGEFRIYEQDGE